MVGGVVVKVVIKWRVVTCYLQVNDLSKFRSLSDLIRKLKDDDLKWKRER